MFSDGSSNSLEPVARFDRELDLSPPTPSLVKDAADAIREEYRSTSRWLRLRCRAVTALANQTDEPLFLLEVGHAIEFDWSWEGSVAFRPSELELYDGDPAVLDRYAAELSGDSDSGDQTSWEGEVVEVDEALGRIYVAVSNPECPPRTGTFLVRPFEFLACLHGLYSRCQETGLAGLLDERLAATRGGIHPPARRTAHNCLPELQPLWTYGWSVLWGPPGTGKTHTLGRQVAKAIADPGERILVVSTTNRASDEAALSIGVAVKNSMSQLLASGQILRIGKGAAYQRFEHEGMLDLLKGTEAEVLYQVSQLQRQLEKAPTSEDRARLRLQIKQRLRGMNDLAGHYFMSPRAQVVVATAFKALTFLHSETLKTQLVDGYPPFTTVFIDEAGLISRSATAALTLLAARRVVVVGDSKQLAPISKISRVLPTRQSIWLASSALSHLERIEQTGPAVHLLRDQHRMHPDISSTVSHYQYGGVLRDAVTIASRPSSIPTSLAGQPRAIWYVLDDDADDLPSVRADRGPGNRSWVRKATDAVLEKLFRDPDVASARGLFISPFKAQARRVAKFFAERKAEHWMASTVHGQQGAEANLVIFDTVNAGSYSWPYDEWKRLVNVALSRARECVIVLASRAEMNEPYLRPLTRRLSPRILGRHGHSPGWEEVPVERDFPVPALIAGNPDLLGHQLVKRKAMRPVMSSDQQRLCGLQMDGGPRLVRGVAGSGKTWVLAHWLQKTIKQWEDRPDAKAWAIYANQALRYLIAETIQDAWSGENPRQPFPWQRAELLHIREVLTRLLREVGQTLEHDDWKYDSAAARYLAAKPVEEIEPRCDAMFIDEAQDLGPNTLKLLTALVRPNHPTDSKSRAVNIFYDNAQNIYSQGTPKWADIGLDMRGRSTVMKESFRSTRPITEFALNVLYALRSPESDPDHRELMARGLIEETSRLGKTWWRVRFNQVDGPPPVVKPYQGYEHGFDAVGDRIMQLVRDEGVQPRDITVIVHRDWAAKKLIERVGRGWREAGIQVTFNKTSPRNVGSDTVVVCTSHSFKGYEAEVVFIAGVEQFVLPTDILANNLYVAMTRARSVLHIYGWSRSSPLERKLFAVLKDCQERMVTDSNEVVSPSTLDDFEDLVERVGEQHREWLANLVRATQIKQEPLVAADGEIVAEPLFWLENNGRLFACFGQEQPGPATRHRLEDAGIELLVPGTVTSSWKGTR